MKKNLRLTICYMTVLLCAAASTAVGQHPDFSVLRVICLPVRPLALVVAETDGVFAKHGISVQAEVAPNSAVLRTGLASGQFAIAHAAVDNEVAMFESGETDVVIVMGGEGSTNEVIAQPGIHSIADLRGKTLIVDAPHTAYALQLKKILLSNGMEAGRDYQLQQVGSTPIRRQAMRENKDFAASMLGAPTSVLAKADGFVSLGTTQQLLGPYQAIGAFVRRSWAQDNSALLVRYIAAFIEAQRWLLAPANKQQVIALMAKEWKLTPTEAGEAYTITVERPGGFENDARFDEEGFKEVLKIRAEVEGQWHGKPPAPERYFDLSYYSKALKSLKSSN
ncbi:MAG: ABC transporter substrate-binding protein [Candidatus Acidiferrales bacterium]